MKDKDIKLLWGRSGNRCAICQEELSPESHNQFFPLGEQAHVVAREMKGPRGSSILTAEERDSYSNLILLCPNHHRLIDNQVELYPVEKLHYIKDAHEFWVQSSLAGDSAEVIATFPRFPTNRVAQKLETASRRLHVWHTWSDYFHKELQDSLHSFLNAAWVEWSADESLKRCLVLLAHPEKAVSAQLRIEELYRDRPVHHLGRLVSETISDLQRAALSRRGMDRNLIEMMEVRLFTGALVMPLYIIDHSAFVGWYPETRKSHFSPFLEIDTQKRLWSESVDKYFIEAWERAEWQWDFEANLPVPRKP